MPPEAVTQFYSNRLAAYRIPDRVQVSYVKFDLADYQAEANQELAQMTNLDQRIDDMYAQGGTNFLREWKAQSVAEAKVKIRAAEQKRIEAQTAKKNAVAFAKPLFDMEPVRAENLEKLAKEKGLTVKITAPFDRENGPKELEVGPDFAQKAFGATPQDPFGGPILGMNSVYVIAFNQKLPNEIPPLDKIRDQVARDYQYSQALNVARKAGMDFYVTLTNGLAQGKALEAKLPLDETKITASLPAFMNAVRQNRQNEAFNDWFRREAEKGLANIPAFRQQTPPSLSPGPSTKKS